MDLIAEWLVTSDPELSKSLSIVSRFDALLEGGAPPVALLRAAVLLCGCPVGYADGAGTVVRVDTRGRVDSPSQPSDAWPRARFGPVGYVWLEGPAPVRMSDEMILSRLALTLAVAMRQRPAVATGSLSPLEVLIDPETTERERALAASRLKLPSGVRVRVRASIPDGEPAAPGVVVATERGRLAATLDGGRAPRSGPVGVGIESEPSELWRSWRSATLSLRIASDIAPVVKADELGPLLRLLETADADPTPHPDAITVAGLAAESRGALRLLDAISATETARSAAALAGVHHSTMQRRMVDLSRRLGYPVGSMEGRLRLRMSLALHRLATVRFD